MNMTDSQVKSIFHIQNFILRELFFNIVNKIK